MGLSPCALIRDRKILDSLGDKHMNAIHMKLLTIASAGILLFSNSIAGQVNPYNPKPILPPEPKATHVQITQGPELDVHFGIVHYGTNPKDLNQTAKNPVHLNRYHTDTIFRVRIDGLSPQTTYYYTVESAEATGGNDGVKSDVKQFSTQ
jgi:hypothetical protein